LTRAAHQNQERISGHAEKQIETKIEIEDAPWREEALQDHRQRQDPARPLRQAPLDGNQSAGRMRKLKKLTLVSKADVASIKQMLPYG